MIEYDEDWLFPVLFRWKGSVYWRAALFAIPGACLAVGFMHVDNLHANFRLDGGLLELGQSTVWSASTAVLLLAIGFRTRQGYARFWEGTGLLHQMKGEWFDTVSNCVTFSITAKKDSPEKVWKFRHTIVRLMSLCHASALEEISGSLFELETIDLRGLDDGTLRHLKECVEAHGFNKVEVLLHLIQSLIVRAHEDQVLRIPPPILSRVFQTCSRGYVNLLTTKKITDTKFPFPFVQLITFLLLVHTLLTPMMMSIFLTNPFTAFILTFVILFGVFSLNFISIELENPFGKDDNDLPLEHFQTEMNSCLLMLLHYNTDIIADTSSRCIMDFHELKATVRLSTEDCAPKGLVSRAQALFLGRPAEAFGSEEGHKRGSSQRLSEISIAPATQSGILPSVSVDTMVSMEFSMSESPSEPSGASPARCLTSGHQFRPPPGQTTSDTIAAATPSPKASSVTRPGGNPVASTATDIVAMSSCPAEEELDRLFPEDGHQPCLKHIFHDCAPRAI